MAQDTVTRCLGLVTQFNPLTVAPGSLLKGENAVVSRENSCENRRGYALYGSLSATPSQLLTYRSKVLAHYSTTIAYDNGSGTFAAYAGSYTAPTGYKMRHEKAKSNLFVTTSAGVKVFTDVTGTAARAAGAPRALDPSYVLNAAGSGFLANTTQCAYRLVIERTDANSNVISGYPSQRLWVTNSSGVSKNVDLTVYLPSDAIAGDVVQIYRTDQVAGVASDTAGDEMKLAYQITLTAAEITAGLVAFTDQITDSLLGATLYTSPSEEGIAQANARPPLCKDLALYKSSFMFYANTSTAQRLIVTLVGTGSLSGKTVTLAGVTYNFGATENTATGTAQVYSSGVAAVDIDNTARSLVRVINRYASNTTVYAYYLSGPEALPGEILLESRSVGSAAFTIQASDTAISGMFYPPPPVGVTNSKSTSSNETFTNRLYFSKADQPEHVPLLNFLNVGPENSILLRVIALRDSLICISDDGVYRLTGETESSFAVVPLDRTVICKAVDSIATLANTVFMLSNQGIVSISDSGVQVVSREIEDQLRPLISYSNVSSLTYGCAYESERMYLLSTVSSSDAAAPSLIYCYNIFTRAWTKWTFGFTTAIVEPTADKLYLSKSDIASVYRERKDFTDSDYSDPDSAATIISISGSTVTFSTLATPVAGWALKQGTTSIVIDSIEASGANYVGTMLYQPPASWVAGAATLFPPVDFAIEWNAWSAGQPALLKHVRQYDILTDQLTGQNNTSSLIATSRTDLDANVAEIEIDSASHRWGSSPWGEFPWGGVDATYCYPTWLPANKQYFRLLTIGVRLRNANEKVAVSGYSLTFEPVSERVSK